jgi:sortase A
MTVRIQWREQRGPHPFVRAAARLLFLGGCLAAAFSVVVYFEARLYQADESRRFDASLSLPRVSAGEKPAMLALQSGSPWSRLEIPWLDLSVMVVEGVRPRDLKLAAGHIPGTATPDASGNVVIAGHRDTFFRKLRDVHPNDLITLTTLAGSYRYSVEWTRVVGPDEVEVMETSSEPLLTLVTCYPFYYVGPAPERFIVRAHRLGGAS